MSYIHLIILLLLPVLVVAGLVSTGVIDANMWNQFKEIHHIKGFLFF